MKPERWRKIETLCQKAMNLQGAERTAYLEHVCAGDKELLEEVTSLLDHEDSEWLQQPLVQVQSSFVFSDDQSVSDQTIGPYRIIKIIASGGMGQVYLGVRNDDQFERFVALKVIRKGLVSEDVLNRFYEERQILASLNHPNIARLFDGGTTEDGIPWFAMEYIEGEPITEYCKQHNLTVEEKINLFLTVCSAVQYAHQNLVIHRDLKPENILITPDGTPKLLDFGIAKLMDLEQKSGQTQYQDRIMTPDYASPEQVRNESISTVSDVYALGILLYELLTGALPYQFDKRTPAEIERTICNTIPKQPSAVSDLKILKGDLDSVIMKALRKEPSERYASVEQLANDLRRYQKALPVLAQKGSFTYRAQKFLSRHKWSVAVSATIVLLVISFSIVTYIQSEAIEARAIETEQQRDRAEQVVDFLVNLFEASDPAQSGGETITARELLERGSRRVEQELDTQPDMQAEMTAVMGRVYTSLGLYEQAEEHARRALARREDLYPKGHPKIAQSFNDLGLIMNERSRYDAADSLFRQALAFRLDHFGEKSLETAESLQNLGWLLVRTNEYATADSLFRRALAIRREIRGNRHPDVAETLNDLGILLRRRGDLNAAEQIQREALAIRREAYGETHRWVGQGLNNLAIVMEDKGDYAAAESLLTEAVEVWSRVLGEEHPDVILALSNLAKQYQYQQEYVKADSLFGYVLRKQKQMLGENHRLVALTLADLASIQQEQGALDRAETLYRQSLNIRRQLFGNNHPEIGWTLEGLADIRRKQEAYADAERLYREALSIYRSAHSQEHPDHAYALLGTGEMLLAQNEPTRAEPMLQKALAIRMKAYDTFDRRTIKARLTLSRCLTDLEQYEAAEPLLKKSYAALQNTQSENATKLIRNTRQALVDLYEAWGRPLQANPYRSETE